VKKSLLFLALLAILCLTLAGCCPPGLPTLTISSIPWPDDEVTSYTIQYQDGSTIGSCNLTIHKDGDTYILTNHSELTIEGTGIIDDITLTVNATDLKPVSGRETAVIGNQTANQTIEITATYSDAQVFITATVDGQEQSITIAVPTDGYDDGEVYFLLRAIPFEVGYAATFSDVVVAAAATPKATIRVVGEEQVDVPAGSFNCYKLELSLAGVPQKQYFWYGVDSPHYLVKLEVEGITMLLEAVSTP
jgi:hypothetical protein